MIRKKTAVKYAKQLQEFMYTHCHKQYSCNVCVFDSSNDGRIYRHCIFTKGRDNTLTDIAQILAP